MSSKKKDNEDSVVIFKQEPGQSKDDAWLIYDTKVTDAENNLHPDHTYPFCPTILIGSNVRMYPVMCLPPVGKMTCLWVVSVQTRPPVFSHLTESVLRCTMYVTKVTLSSMRVIWTSLEVFQGSLVVFYTSEGGSSLRKVLLKPLHSSVKKDASCWTHQLNKEVMGCWKTINTSWSVSKICGIFLRRGKKS